MSASDRPAVSTRTYRAWSLRGGRIIDPASGRDEEGDISVVDGVVAERAPSDAHVVDATGWIICPGLIDLHVHLREPGQSHKETIETGTAAAAAGGFTLVACMPNTNPPLDDPVVVRWVIDRAETFGYCAVRPVAAITRGRRGRELTDFAALREAGAVAFSDDGDGVEDEHIMRAALARARELDVVIVQHCEFKSLSAGGVMNDGPTARRLGLPGLDPRSEEAMIERDVGLSKETGGRYHVAHISTARAVDLVRQAKAQGVPVTAEVTPHHLILTDEACIPGDSNTKMHPPLRTPSDVDACRRGLLDGTIDFVASDHAPHTTAEKARGFRDAPPGVSGLETTLALLADVLIKPGLATWSQVIGWLTNGPAKAWGLAPTPITPGLPANLTLIDPSVSWVVDPSRFVSMGRNTPFIRWSLSARPIGTLCGYRFILHPDAHL